LSPFLAACLFLFISNSAVARDKASLAECRRALLVAELKEQPQAEALAICEQTAAKHSKDPWAYRYRAMAYSRAGDTDKAAEDIQTALERVRANRYSTEQTIKSFKVWAAGGYDVFAWQNAVKGEWERAAAEWSRVIELNPSWMGTFLYRGVARARAGQCADAVADFDRFLAGSANVSMYEDNSDRLYALARKGECSLKLGRTEAARAIARQMMDVDPRLAAKFAGDAGLKLFEPEACEKNMQEAATAARAAETAGNVLEAFRQWEEVRKWPEVLVVTPLFAGFYSQGAEQLLQESVGALLRLYPKLPVKPALPEEARQFAVPAEREAQMAAGEGPTAPGSPTPEVDKNRYWRAINLYDRALTMAPWWPMGYFNRAFLKSRLDQYASATEDMKLYVALAPDAPNFRNAQDRLYEWKARVGSAGFDARSLIGPWSRSNRYSTLEGRIAPARDGGVKLMVLDSRYGKRSEPVGHSYRLSFDGRKFKAIPDQDATDANIVGGEVSPAGDSIEMQYKVYVCRGLLPPRCGDEINKSTWTRGHSEELAEQKGFSKGVGYEGDGDRKK
jgi:tetratricopeptide (TPR) repeat protein